MRAREKPRLTRMQGIRVHHETQRHAQTLEKKDTHKKYDAAKIDTLQLTTFTH